MSEHHHYEFLALDRRLSEAQIAALRKLSSRATITPERFFNVYDWGDFEGDPDALMRDCFDLHLYVANWGTRVVMFGFDAEAISPETLAPYLVGELFQASRTEGRLVLELFVEETNSDLYAEEGAIEGLAPLREEVLRGDMRPLYLCWLIASVAMYGPEDEPPREAPAVPSGLDSLTPAQQALVELFELDQDVLRAAAALAGERHEDGAAPLFHAISERGAKLRRSRLAKQNAAKARATKRREAERRAELLARLDDQEEMWKQVWASIEQRNENAYRSASALLVELREIARLLEEMGNLQALPNFESQLAEVKAHHSNKPMLLRILRSEQL